MAYLLGPGGVAKDVGKHHLHPALYEITTFALNYFKTYATYRKARIDAPSSLFASIWRKDDGIPTFDQQCVEPRRSGAE